MSQQSLIGKQIDEYKLEALLGEGGMASVYRALDVRLNRYVAVKVIRANFRSMSDYTMRFEREARAVAQLEHPNIITIYRYGEVDGLLYMAMQYVDGADLASVIESYHADGELIEFDEIIRLAHEVGTALDYAHSKGVIHRDIKPHNILITKDGRAIVTDFGLALLTQLGTRGEIFGSPHYIAPEQAISSAGVVPQTDLYALGVMLYEMLTGVVPFDAEQPLDISMKHMSVGILVFIAILLLAASLLNRTGTETLDITPMAVVEAAAVATTDIPSEQPVVSINTVMPSHIH
jgi:eukaryotic-like serine/threonine-protein kinase